MRGHRDWSGINGTPEGCTTCPGLLERAVDLATDKINRDGGSGTLGFHYVNLYLKRRQTFAFAANIFSLQGRLGIPLGDLRDTLPGAGITP